MATTAQKKTLEVLKYEVLSTENRFTGYHDELMKTLHNIWVLENDRPYNIAQLVSREVTVLGERLVQEEGNLE